MNTPHKHAELIKAWADGAKIEYKLADKIWLDAQKPVWDERTEYRIKPEEKKPVVRWLWAREDGFIDGVMSDVPHGDYTIKLEWSAQEFTK